MRGDNEVVTPEDAAKIVELLRARGKADDITAAAAIEHGLEPDLYTVLLTPAERVAVLTVLVDPPDSLTALRGMLARDSVRVFDL